MKKIFILATIAGFLYTYPAISETIDYLNTGVKLNGDFAIQSSVEDPNRLNYYLAGVIDTITRFKPDAIKEHYSGYSIGGIYDKLTKYYYNNPDKRNRTIVDVLMTGCK